MLANENKLAPMPQSLTRWKYNQGEPFSPQQETIYETRS